MGPDPIDALRTPYKLNRWLLHPSYRAGDVDARSVDVPFLFWHEGRYRMYFIGLDALGYRTVLASSDDLLSWQREGVVVPRGQPGSDTEFSVTLTSVLRDQQLYGRGDARRVDGRLLGVWHGYPELGHEQGRGYIGIARGDGLCDWKLAAPCLRADDGAPWEQGGLYKPCLVEHQGRYFIFYNAKNTLHWPWREQIGMAWSDDLLNWTRHPGNPLVPNGPAGSRDEWFTADPLVLRHRDVWVMFYYGLAADGHARELAAFSDDLLNWRNADDVLIDVGPQGSIDAQHAHKPGVIARDGVLYHFYGASRRKTPADVDDVQSQDRRGIALATSRPVENPGLGSQAEPRP